jgi:hypothetical protein
MASVCKAENYIHRSPKVVYLGSCSENMSTLAMCLHCKHQDTQPWVSV